MKIFAENSILKKIIIILVLLTSVWFVKPKPVQAGIGGELMQPVCDLLVSFMDGLMSITQEILCGQQVTLIRVNLTDSVWDSITRVVIAVTVFLAVLAAAAAIVYTGGLAAGAVMAALELGGGTIASSVVIANIVPILVVSTYFGVKAYNKDAFERELDLPLYSISPERIFSNSIPFFDVNFFNPNSAPFKYEWILPKNNVDYSLAQPYLNGEIEYDAQTGTQKETRIHKDFKECGNPTGVTDSNSINKIIEQGNPTDVTKEFTFKSANSAKEFTYNGKRYIYWVATNPSSHLTTNGWYVEKTEEEKKATSTPDAIEAKGTGEKYAITHELADVIKRWYYIIRLMAIVGMMSALVYIGIRILLSSTSSQKAKYKQLLGDWFVGMVLLFTMHFIMSFSNIAVDHLTELFKTINPMGQTALIPDEKDKVEKELGEYGIEVVKTKTDITGDNSIVYKDSEQKYIEWNTDLMGQLRIALQASRNGSEAYIGYTIMYIALVIFTATFCFVYIRRVIYMAFLTIIAPLVALTYPIDKANDGNAQGFNYWFKEYIFNLLIQPLHLLLYTILVSSAAKFASENIIYSLVALGFIVSAEKILRQMFNFSKASTPGIFAGPAGAALTMTGMRWLFGHGPKGEKGTTKGSGTGEEKSEDQGMISSGKNKFDMNDAMSDLLGSGKSDNQNSAEEVKKNLKKMREAEEEESLFPSEEQRMMWENDNNYFDDSEDMKYDDKTYEQILRDSGYSEEDIAKEMGKNNSEANDNEKPKIKGFKSIFGNAYDAFKKTPVGGAFDNFKNASGEAMDAYKDGMRKKLYRKLENAQPVKALGRMAVGAMGAATAGMIGTAAGVAAGDAKSVAQNLVAGAAVGSKFGTGLYDSIQSSTNVDGVREAYERKLIGNDAYNERIIQRNRRRIVEDEKNIKLVQEKLGKTRAQAKEWLSSKEVSTMMDAKISNVSDMINIHNLTEKGPEIKDKYGTKRKYTTKEAISARNTYNRYDISKKTGKEEDVIKQISNDYTDGNIDNARILYNAAKAYDDILNG